MPLVSAPLGRALNSSGDGDTDDATGHFAVWSCDWVVPGKGLWIVAARALVVDDDPDIRRLVGVLLEVEGGWRCDEAGDALHALELWHAHHHDVVVVDHRLPRVTGIDLATALLEENPGQIVVLFSAYLDNQVVDRALQLGVCAVLSKDEIRRLPEVIGEALAS